MRFAPMRFAPMLAACEPVLAPADFGEPVSPREREPKGTRPAPQRNARTVRPAHEAAHVRLPGVHPHA
ncbi:MAG: hypothetical protein R3B70_01995 [Polyangiaceae bacterium]